MQRPPDYGISLVDHAPGADAVRIVQASSPSEREADAAAVQVMNPIAIPHRVRPRLAVGATITDGALAPPSVTAVLRSPGRALPAEVRGRFEPAFGRDFSAVRIHTDAPAEHSAADIGAAAYAVGPHIVFGAGQYAAGTADGQMLLAHELAHVAQAAAAAGAAPRLHRRLIAEAPDDLTTPQAKAAWINTTLETWTLGKGRAICDLLMTLSASEFIDIQPLLNLDRVFAAMDDWDRVRVGTLGPVTAGPARDRLNRARADYIFEVTRERGPDQAQVVTYWIVANMYGDDIGVVLGLLAGDQRLYRSIDQMPEVKRLIESRGVDLRAYSDRGWESADVPRGLWAAVGDALGSSPGARDARGGAYMLRDQNLPKAYGKAMHEVEHAQMMQAWAPGNVALGTLDYMAFNIPSSIVGAGQATVSGVGELSRGHVEAGTEQLTGPTFMVVSLALGVRAFRRAARVSAMMELSGEGQATLARLRASIGNAGVQRVARYVQADSQAAILVREEGLAGIESLARSNGNVEAARALIGAGAARLRGVLGAEALRALGLDAQQALATLSDDALRSAAGASGATLEALSRLLQAASPTMRAHIAALLEADATGFSRVLQERGPSAVEAFGSGPIGSAAELEKAAQRAASRVRVPVVKDGVTLYESIDPANPPPDWEFRDVPILRDGSLRTNVTGPPPLRPQGYFIRRYNAATGQFEMLEAYLRSNEAAPSLPESVPGGTELIPGRGTPTGIFASLRLLRVLGVAPGSLRRITLSNIENFATLCRLEWLRQNLPGRSLDSLIMETESVRYAQTTAEQAGSSVSAARVIGGEVVPIGEVMKPYRVEAAEAAPAAAARVRGEHEALLSKYGFTDETPMLARFTIELDLQPIPQASAGPSAAPP